MNDDEQINAADWAARLFGMRSAAGTQLFPHTPYPYPQNNIVIENTGPIPLVYPNGVVQPGQKAELYYDTLDCRWYLVIPVKDNDLA